MEEKKLYELKFELKEITGGPNSQVVCQVEIGENKEITGGKSQVVLSGLEVSVTSNLSLAFLCGEKVIGTTKVSVGTLFSESLQGKFDKWFKLKSEDFPSLRAKIAASLTKIEKAKAKPKTASRRSSKGPKEIKCPYLENLATGKEKNTEPLNEIWKNRDNSMQNFIRISLEPDSPSRCEDSPEFSADKIEEISVEKLQQMTGSQLKQIVKVLCEEARHLSVISQKLPEMREELNRKVQERRNLEQSSQSEIDSIKGSWVEMHEKIEGLLEKRKNAKLALLDKQEQSRKFESELDILKAHLGDLKRESILLSTQKLQYDDCIKTRDKLNELISQSLAKKKALQEKVTQAEADLAKAHQEAQRDIEKIKQDRDEAKQKIAEVDQEYKSAHAENEELKKKINELKGKLSDAHDLKLKVSASIESYKAESAKRDEVNNQLHLLTTDLEKQSNEILLSQQDLLAIKKASSSKLFDLENSIEAKELEILDLRKRLFEATSQKISQEQICCLRADLAQLIEDLERLHKLHAESRTVILRDLEAGSRILLDESEKVYMQAEKLDGMIDAVDKKEEELDGLKDAMGEVKKRNPPYVPVKDDPTDVVLAEYLNAKETPVPIKFMRQDGGNYLFGSKKVYIKVENGKILVKVGGGFTSIDEFLAIYTPVEVEKSENSPRGSPGLMSLGKYSKDSSPRAIAQKMSSVFDRSPKKP